MTRASDLKPVRRVMSSMSGEFVVELRERIIIIRPKGTRKQGKAEVGVTVGAIYQRALMAQIDSEKRAKRAARKSRR